jgi:hypothetical protein
MTDTLTIAMAQLSQRVGDLVGNADAMLAWRAKAMEASLEQASNFAWLNMKATEAGYHLSNALSRPIGDPPSVAFGGVPVVMNPRTPCAGAALQAENRRGSGAGVKRWQSHGSCRPSVRQAR